MQSLSLEEISLAVHEPRATFEDPIVCEYLNLALKVCLRKWVAFLIYYLAR